MPTNGLRVAPDELVAIILAQIEDNDVDLIARPSPELVASWKRGEYEDAARPEVCSRWAPGDRRCLVCHRDLPDGEATAYAHLKARVCIDYCSDLVKDLERIRDRSPRGRWRPSAQVRKLANGALCNDCQGWGR
jgi:hypothetical protein